MFDGVEIFSATKHRDRAELGDRINEWLNEAKVEIVDTIVTQSSDNAYHCLTLVFFYRDK